MSLESWKSEFYPVEAEDAANTDINATRHSLRKWIGLRKENLERHGLVKNGAVIEGDDDCLTIDGESCALCVRNWDQLECETCPLQKVRGVSCDSRTESGELAPYLEFIGHHSDPEPMISALKATLDMLLEEEGSN